MMKYRIDEWIMVLLRRYGFIRGGRVFYLNEAYSTNGWMFVEPWRSDGKDTIQLEPGY